MLRNGDDKQRIEPAIKSKCIYTSCCQKIAYRTASQTSSTQETQLDTMISLARGFHADSVMLPRLVNGLKSNILLNCLIPTYLRFVEISSTGIQNSPSTKRAVRPRMKVMQWLTRRCKKGKGIYFRQHSNGSDNNRHAPGKSIIHGQGEYIWLAIA